nr:hypothetical protein DA06_18635 [Georgenia sp. SUBG003]
MAARGDGVVAELLAGGEAQLLTHEVDPGDLLAHRVLDLQARVDLEEGDRPVDADEELAGARTDVAGLLQDRPRRLDELALLLGGEERCRGLLDELLVPTLQRAVARGDHDDVAGGVGQALGLDVAGPVEEPLDEALPAAERRGGLADGGVEQLGDLLAGAGDLQAAAAAAVGGLDRDRQPVGVGEGEDLGRVRHRVGRARHQRCADPLGDVAGGDLVAQRLDRRGRRADPDEARVEHRAGEVGVLGEEAVSRVDGVRAGAARDVEDLARVQVRLRGAHATEGEGLVRQLHVERVAVRVRVHPDRGDAGVGAGPGHPDRDLAAVGDEHLPQRAMRARQDGGARHGALPWWRGGGLTAPR